LGERGEAEGDGVASEERSALLHGPLDDPADAAVADDSALNADPTQRLLTSLGRFQRQVARAEGGAPQHVWTDDCIEQLIAGIEIAHENGWEDVKEALTDTARILQSYEEAQAADHAVPFLKDSYEILCLMVGDIIVNSVRSGVMDKWRQRYARALQELARNSVPLIGDDGEEIPIGPPDNIVHFNQSSYAAAPVEAESPFAEPEIDDDVDGGEDEIDTDEEAPVPEFVAGGAQPTAAEMYFAALEEEQRAAAALAAQSIAEEEQEESTGDDLSLDPFVLPDDDVETSHEADLTHDEPAVYEDEDTADIVLPPLEETAASSAALDSEDDMEPAPAEFVEEAAPAPVPVEAYAEPVVEAPRPAAPMNYDGDISDLLRHAQTAMSRGDVTNAKTLALEVAVRMARLEAERAKDDLRVAEARLDDNARAVDAAGESVRRAEAGVQDVEEQIAQREAEFQQKRGHISGLRDTISDAHERITHLDEEIKRLMAQRDEEEIRLSGLQDELHEGLAAESRIQTDLDVLGQEEEAAREALDASKQRVRDLHRERLAREADIAEAQDNVRRQLDSVADIQRTLRQVAGLPEEAPEEAEAEAATETVMEMEAEGIAAIDTPMDSAEAQDEEAVEKKPEEAADEGLLF